MKLKQTDMSKIVYHSAKLFSIVLSIVILSSCASTSTVITGSWEKPDVEKKYDNLIVEAFTPQVEVKEALQLQMTTELIENGIYAAINEKPLPPAPVEDDKDRQDIMNGIKENGADGILTIAIIDKAAESRYTPGPGRYAPYPRYPYYGSFWGYYDYWYPHFHRPGYYSLENVYYIETNIFDAESEELIWSAQSKTYESTNLETFSEDYAKEVVEEMIEDGIIRSAEEEKE